MSILSNNSIERLSHATSPGQWMLHCHNIYYLKAGTATVLSYRGS